ncbi:MAG: biotin--[acetyl-CoA-carboxylase] ligase [Eubacteriales bacterium]|nr:biotin--[acetyl-CoA-carboxylase] ligase [Eubacteriales bacterium]
MSVKSNLLELLELNKGESLSGEAIANSLNCTRAAVWKAVKSLQQEGYLIEAVKNRGYRLKKENNRLSAEGIRAYLNYSGNYIKVYEEIESTNKAAKQAVVQGIAEHGALIAAVTQTDGRGRRGRNFYSPQGGLYMSCVLQPKETIQESLLITTAAATSVYQAVKEVCGISLDIKWVNDLYKDSKKVCGILTEAITDFESGNIDSIIVGIGLNLFIDEEMLPEELKPIVGALFENHADAQNVDKNKLVACIMNHLLEEMKCLKLSDVYVQRNMIPGNRIQIDDGNSIRYAKAISICDDGKLLVEEEDGTQSRLVYGEVSVSLKK